MSDEEPVRLVLTPEQREIIHRASGQHVDAIELAKQADKKEGGVLRFLWRLSSGSGIARQKWMTDDGEDPAK